MAKIADKTGQRFGRLKVIKLDRLERKSNGTYTYWLCVCDCGNTKSVDGSGLKTGKTRSCGCLNKETNSKRFWKGCGELSGKYMAQIRCRAKRYNRECSVSIKDCWNQFLKQKGICAMSGVTITLTRNNKNQTASLDRIDSSKGYVKGNIQWIHKELQLMKSDLSEESFVNWCKTIAEYRSGHGIGC